jgi:hypothetical protein
VEALIKENRLLRVKLHQLCTLMMKLQRRGIRGFAHKRKRSSRKESESLRTI